MSSPLRRIAVVAALAVGALVLPASPVVGAPADSKPGDVRVTFSKTGTALRAEGAATGAPVGAPLPAGTSVTVLEVKLPWIRVRTPAGTEGWLRAYETVEPSALGQSAQPPYVTGVGAGQVTDRQASAAGRQFSEETERDYRRSNRNLEAAYAAVNAMEEATRQMDPYESIAFIVDGDLGRRGRTYERPDRLPPVPEESESAMDIGDVVDALDKLPDLPGPFGKLKPKIPGKAKKVIRIAGKAAKALRTLEKMDRGFNTTQEYYVGRAVAAQAIARWGVDPDESRRRYVRLVGDAIVRLADPMVSANHGGYHFEVLNCPDVNAVSGPGGFVLVSRGAVEAARDEEELAGFIAHELAHVVRGHGTQMLMQSQRYQNNRKAFVELLKAGGMDDGAVGGRMTQFFADSVSEMSGRAADHQYSQQFEFDADAVGTQLLAEVLYRVTAIRDELRYLGQTGRIHGGAGHADPMLRAQTLDGLLARPEFQTLPNAAALEAPRNERFAVAMRRTPPVPPAAGPGVPPPPPPPIPLPPR